jgi:peptidyl-prolyl cis-trans isomerase D
MLQLMRKKAQSWMIKVIFGVIIVVFVFFYGYRQKSDRRSVIAEVNGTKIADTVLISEYQKAYQNLVRLYQSIYKDAFDERMIDQIGLRARILNDIIDDTLMRQEAERLSLQVGPEELQAAVSSNPIFQVDGKFNQLRFQTVLQANQVGVDEFWESEERNRLMTKLTNLIGLGGVDLSDQEILNAYVTENEKINLQFIQFKASDYETSVTVNDSEIEAFYAENSTLFEMPPRVQVQYMVFAGEEFVDVVEISPEEVREEYEINLDDYQIPKRVKVSHIFIRRNGEDEDTAEQKARERAEEILERASEGDDFALLARDHSEDPDSVDEGGSIGWVTQGESVPEFAEMALSLEKGEIGPLVESEDGFHIVRVDDVQEERVKGLEEVEAEIRDRLIEAKSRQVAEEETEEAFFATFETKDLTGYAAGKGRALKTTAFFSRDEKLEEVGGNLEFNGHAFSLEEGEVSSPLKIGGKDYLIKLIKREDSRIPPIEEVKEDVKAAVLREKSKEKATVLAQNMVEEIRGTGSLTKTAAAKGLDVEETGLFERSSSFIPKVGPIKDMGKGISSLSSENPRLGEVVSYGSIFFVMELKEEQKIDMGKFEDDKEQYQKRVYAEKRGRILQQWLDSLRKKSEIKIRAENLPL